MIDGFNPDFDDATWTLDWLRVSCVDARITILPEGPQIGPYLLGA
jgi:hypothetical protein